MIPLANVLTPSFRRRQTADALVDAAVTKARPIKKRGNASVTVEIVIPVYNEAASLRRQIDILDQYLRTDFPYRYTITIADNGSTDSTWAIAQELAVALPHVAALHLDRKGRGYALKTAWLKSKADILAYMDADLSTDLDDLVPLLSPLVRGEAKVATGSRLQKNSHVQRGLKREIISRCYNYLLRAAVGLKTSDAQCGFKAIRADYAKTIVPTVADDAWFFDTELLVKAEKSGEAVHEVAVTWQEDTDSRVNIIDTAMKDIKGIRRLKKEFRNRPRWELWTITGIVVGTIVLYAFGASKNGYGNSFYAAAVQAASHSWKALFFGSLDASNYITVDKPPFAIWAMALSSRVFGFHTWSMLLPNVLAGAGTVYLVYAAVRRWFSSSSALIAAAVMALTPVAVLMFGFNNPDALLTLLLTGSVYAFLRAIDSSRPILWLSLAGILTGCAFNTKMLQGFFVLPILAMVYLYAAKQPFWKRLRHLLIVGIPTAFATLWWPVVVSLVPAANRPYIGSSTNNSIWNLIFGYNGFGRLLGSGSGQAGGMGAAGGFGGMTPPTGTGATMSAITGTGGFPAGGIGMAGGHGPGGTGFGGSTGIFRMFNSDFGPNIAWFIPLSLFILGVALWLLRKMPRTDKRRTAYLVWGGYLIIHIVLFSMVSGVIHPYYPVVMAPAIAALVGMGLPMLIRKFRDGGNGALLLPIGVIITGITACGLLSYSIVWLPWLRWMILAGSIVMSLALVVYSMHPVRRWFRGLLIGAGLTMLAAPLAFSIATVSVAHVGSIPTSGPTATAMQRSNNETASAEASFVSYLLQHRGSSTWIVAVASANESAAIQLTSQQPVMALGGFTGSDNAMTVARLKTLIASGQLRYYAVSASGAMGGGMGNNTVAAWIAAHAKTVAYGGTNYTLYDLSTAF